MEYNIKEVAIDGTETVREMTEKEKADFIAAQKKWEAEQAAKEAEQAAKESAKAELLTKLGITEDEAKLLLS